MRENKRLFKKLNLNRKKIISQLLMEIFSGALLGVACAQAISITSKEYSGWNTAIMILLFVVMIIFLCTPLWMPVGQIYDIDENRIKVIPPYSVGMKWKLIMRILCKDDISTFVETIDLSQIYYGEFSVEKRYAGWGYQNYTYLLTLHLEARDIAIVINPIDNGVFIPGGKGGFIFDGLKSRKEICNIIRFFEVNQVRIEDPYHMIKALENPDIVIYDYLDSLDIKTRY